MTMRRKAISAIFAVTVLCVPVYGLQGQWVSGWSTAVHSPLPFPGLPPSPTFENQTVRMVVRGAIGGERIRVRFSNAFGATPLEFGGARVALVRENGRIITGSDRPLTFGGETSVKIPAGSPMLSDPVDLPVKPFAEMAISIFLPKRSQAVTQHSWAQHESYISSQGDYSGAEEIPDPTVTQSWYWLEAVEFWAPKGSAAIVTLGDSITDGVGAKQGEYGDWPDLLAKRLAVDNGGPSLAVDNEGIGGNRILYDGAGVNALARLDRDVLSQAGVSELIVLEGINDIGWPHMKPRTAGDTSQPRKSPFGAELVTATQLIEGLRQIVDRAHEHEIRVFGATLTPYYGADYYSDDGEAVRQGVNQWIRSSGAFDAVIDFDAAVRDPDHLSQFRNEYQSGDHLHRSAAGYKAMADVVDLAVLRTVKR